MFPLSYVHLRRASIDAKRKSLFHYVQDLVDYDVDSDDEWEEEEPGESLSNSEVSVPQ